MRRASAWAAIGLCAAFWCAVAYALPTQPPARYWPHPGVVYIIADTPAATLARCTALVGRRAEACSVCPLIYLPLLPEQPLLLGYLLIHEWAHCLGGWPGDHPRGRS